MDLHQLAQDIAAAIAYLEGLQSNQPQVHYLLHDLRTAKLRVGYLISIGA